MVGSHACLLASPAWPSKALSGCCCPYCTLSLLCLTGYCAVQREILRQIAVLNDRLYMGIRAEQVLPGATAAKRPDASHWKTVMVGSQPFSLLAAEAHEHVMSKEMIVSRLACVLAPSWLLTMEPWSVLLSCKATRNGLLFCDSCQMERGRCLRL